MLDRTRNAVAPRHHTMHVPRTMFAAAIDRFGGPEELTGHALPVPAGEVLIAVDTAGVGPWDADVREGYYRPQATFSACARLRRRPAPSLRSARGCGG